MDNRERTLKLEIGGVEYEAAPISEEELIILTTLRAKSEAVLRAVKTVCRVVETAVGQEAWGQITDRWQDGEISFTDIGEAVPVLLKLSVAAKNQSGD